jgi:molybdopterin adenylyltransferase
MSTEAPRFRAAVLVVSDRVAGGTHEDASGKIARELLAGCGCDVVHEDVVPDLEEAIEKRLCHYADQDRLDLVLTTGGTGFAPRDVTPEATQGVLEREAPGVSELLRRETARTTPLSALSRGVAGTRGRTLIVNLPGSPRGVRECLNVLAPLLPHALRVLRGEPSGHVPWDAKPQ